MDSFQAAVSHPRLPTAMTKRTHSTNPPSPRSQPPPRCQAAPPSPMIFQKPAPTLARSMSLQQLAMHRQVAIGRMSAPNAPTKSPNLGSKCFRSPGVAWPAQQGSDSLTAALQSLSPVRVDLGQSVASAAVSPRNSLHHVHKAAQLSSPATPTMSAVAMPSCSVPTSAIFGHPDIDGTTKTDSRVLRNSEQDILRLEKQLRAELGQAVAEAAKPVEELCRQQAKELEDLRTEQQSFIGRETGMQEVLKTCLDSCAAAREIAGSTLASSNRIPTLEDLCKTLRNTMEEIQRQQAAILERDLVTVAANREAHERQQQLQQAFEARSREREFRLAQDLRQDVAQACETSLSRLKLDLTELRADLVRRCSGRELGDSLSRNCPKDDLGGGALLAVEATAVSTRARLDQLSQEFCSRLHKVEREMLIERAARAPPRLSACGMQALEGFDRNQNDDFHKQLCSRMESAVVLRTCLEEEVAVLEAAPLRELDGVSLELLEERLRLEERARRVLERALQDAEA